MNETLNETVARKKAIRDRLGLQDGNCGDDSFAHNGSWYLYTGEKFGWGDLGLKEIVELPAKLQENEIVVVVGEHDSYWDFQGKTLKVNPEFPGQAFLILKARSVITKDGLKYIHDNDGDREVDVRRRFLEVISTKEFAKMLWKMNLAG